MQFCKNTLFKSKKKTAIDDNLNSLYMFKNWTYPTCVIYKFMNVIIILFRKVKRLVLNFNILSTCTCWTM